MAKFKDIHNRIAAPPEPRDATLTRAGIALAWEESDRACIVMGMAYLEELIGDSIARVIVDDKKLREDLLRPEHPLGSLASRIDTLFAIGHLRASDRQLLHALRELRNEAAHTMFAETPFFGPDIRAKLAALLNLDSPLADNTSYTAKHLFVFAVVRIGQNLLAHNAEVHDRSGRSTPPAEDSPERHHFRTNDLIPKISTMKRPPSPAS